MLSVEPSTSSAPSGQAAGSTAWPEGDLERRLIRALDFAEQAIADFGETGYVDQVRPALGFGPEKVVAETAMIAYASYGVGASAALDIRVASLAAHVAPLVRSSRALADLALDPEQAFRRAVPHVLLTAMGLPHDDFDDFAADRCARVLAHAADQPATVLAERSWLAGTWGRALPERPETHLGTVISHPFDLLLGSREDAYGLTHLLFYVTDFGRVSDVEIARPRSDLLADVEALLVRYLDQGDYDLVGELLMAWPQLREQWSPVAAFAFRLLARVEDEVGVLPCGNVDMDRLAALVGAERTRYARAASYHTALVMGFLCGAVLRSGMAPPTRLVGPEWGDEAWQELRALVGEHAGDWLSVFDACPDDEKRVLVPMLGDLAIAQALRRREFAVLHEAVATAARAGLPSTPMQAAAADLLRALGTAMVLSGGGVGQD